MIRRQFVQGLGLLLAAPAWSSAAWAGPGGRDRVPPPKDFSSNHNYYVYGGGQPLRGLVVTVDVTEDMVVTKGGLNMQLNGYSPADANCVYQQYCMAISPKHVGRLGWSNENFPSKAYRWQLHNTLGRSCRVPNPTEATCKGDIFNMNTGEVATSPSLAGRFTAGSKLVWELLENAAGAIVGATYSFVDPQGHRSSTGPQRITSFRLDGANVNVGQDALSPLLAFQLNIVGLNGGAHTTLSSGAGSITYEAKSLLEAKSRQPDGTAARGTSTEESSNITYATLDGGSKHRIVQQFSVA